MPWKEVLAPEARSDWSRLQGKKGIVQLVVSRFGISRKSAYKWLKRYRAGGVQALRDRRVGLVIAQKRIALFGANGW